MDNVDDELLKGHEVDDAEEKEVDDKESENASVSSSHSDAEGDPDQPPADELSEEENMYRLLLMSILKSGLIE